MAIPGFGTLLQKGDGDPVTETFTTIAEVQDISGPELALDTQDVTHHSSPGGWEEVIATILRSGEITFDVNFIPTDPTHDPQTGLIADLKARTLRNFRLVFPDAGSTTWAITALVTGVGLSEPVTGQLAASITLKPSGDPTLAAV